MENRIKEQRCGLFADHTSCHQEWPNQLRLLLSSAAYLLVKAIRRLGLHGTELTHAQVETIRLTRRFYTDGDEEAAQLDETRQTSMVTQGCMGHTAPGTMEV